MAKSTTIPVIDIFAGPGGLGEGFAAFRTQKRQAPFTIGLSIEKDEIAHRTLRLRSFFRQFESGHVPISYYDAIRNEFISDDDRWRLLKSAYPKETQTADNEARRAELGKIDSQIVDEWICRALQRNNLWILIGGPPCQAYSLAGRSRNIGNPDYIPEQDHRQYLYKEYLRILARHRPPIFIMENVKGLLSATIQNERIFAKILDDLSEPKLLNVPGRQPPKTRYRIFPLTHYERLTNPDVTDFVVRMEQFGIPQARHRIILLGIREDFGNVLPDSLIDQDQVCTRHVLSGLPELRSGLSKSEDNLDLWRDAVSSVEWQGWITEAVHSHRDQFKHEILSAISKVKRRSLGRGGEYMPFECKSLKLEEWFLDPRLDGALNHASRSHIKSDLNRYFYASIFAKVLGVSPNLSQFPRSLLPKHRNVESALKGGNFSDRFRVQTADRPSTTVTSHIAKDGHYYIHYDPSQCRSLTVREAARLQTFPDNYFFCGPRTAQYLQVGNAVPPLLAVQIAAIVHKLIKNGGSS